MPIDFKALEDKPRILIEVALKPVAGTRIQPTGFPDLGPAVYDAPDGNDGTVPTLLVESAQSMANRLEAVCWDEATDDIAAELGPAIREGEARRSWRRHRHHEQPAGIPPAEFAVHHDRRDEGGNSLHRRPEARARHALGGGTGGKKRERSRTQPARPRRDDGGGGEKERDDVAGVVNLRKLAAVCFKYDPNSLVHGVFLEKIAGRLRHPRALSAFIEASGVGRADSGGVKFDRALPKPNVAGVDAKSGYGNVPFHRTEFTAKSITAFFSLDLAQIRGYGLGEDAGKLLIALSLWKVRRFLDSNMRLRTACELELTDGEKSIQVKRPRKDSLSAPRQTWRRRSLT